MYLDLRLRRLSGAALAAMLLVAPFAARGHGVIDDAAIAGFDLAALQDPAETPAARPEAVIVLPAAAEPGPPPADPRYRSFGAQVGAVKWEVAGLLAYITATNSGKVIRDPAPFRFKNEGWFGTSTNNVGVDKITHAYNTYLIAELLQWRMKRRTGDVDGAELTAAALATGLTLYTEMFDAFEGSSGFSYEDVVMNMAGAGFSLMRNTVPGLREKLAFRLMVIPNKDIYSHVGKRHYAQQRFLMALQLSGFEGMERSPLRFVELHAGYYATGFTNAARARGERPRQRPFIGVGINLRELFFRSPKSSAGRIARGALDYLQLPFTAIHQPLNGDIPLP